MTLGEFKDLAGELQSIATIASFMIGGTWAYQKFIRQQEKYPNIEFLAVILMRLKKPLNSQRLKAYKYIKLV